MHAAFLERASDAADNRVGWITPEISLGESIHGLYGALLSVRDMAETQPFADLILLISRCAGNGRLSGFVCVFGGKGTRCH
jgi:hypothetical protein